jgi:hypothetical protein
MPRQGTDAIRLLAAIFEIANTDELLRSLHGATAAPPPYRMGSLATAWPRLAAATSPAQIRDVLRGSPWGDPGAESLRAGAMGLRYPSEASYRAPAPDTGSDTGTGATTGAALQQACAAHRLALDAAVRHAAAQAALRAIEAEMAANRRRLHAVEDRWIPRLESTLAAVLLELAEAERSEGVRLRWAADTVNEPGGGER